MAEWSSRSDAYGKSGGRGGIPCKKSMPVTYILKSLKDGRYYYGSTRNLTQRIKDHNRGKVKSTKGRRPLVIHYDEEYQDMHEASTVPIK